MPAGGFTKPCNTTGTATNSGIAEATVNFRLSQLVSQRLRRLGARVRMTRTTNSDRLWGPCVDARGEFGKRVGARLMVSLHADGASASGYGFHVIAPTSRSPWTTDIASSSLRLATALRDSLTRGGLPRSTYVGGGTGFDVRSDLGTLNMSDVPVAMIEIGNMRNASDARRMTSRRGRARMPRPWCGGSGRTSEGEGPIDPPCCPSAAVLLLAPALASSRAAAGRTRRARAPAAAVLRRRRWPGHLLGRRAAARRARDDRLSTWVEKYAGGDQALGDAMRDDAAFEHKVDCDKPHTVELYSVVSLGPRGGPGHEVRRPAGPDHAPVPQDQRPGEQPLPRRVAVRRGRSGRPAVSPYS